MSKGLQITIPARLRNELDINENTLLEIELDKQENWIIIKPVKTRSLKELFAECDAIKNKTNKSVEEMREEYERENMLH
ncbi:MAG TPA: AbrB/MazE/SpoVT family DNA-binding domain-containing protein [Candidatus Nanoarchaeia archaeon]|nr:AbrB/MazE/SpoVT family DNA-binding domain-containing protein [Candidatus Nanoarchaeia archaeon]